MTPQAAQNRVNAVALATNLVKITATGSSPRAAETLANAVANRLVVFVTSSNLSNASSALAGLQAQAAQLTKQVNRYDQEIQVQQAAIQSHPKFRHSPTGHPASGLADDGPGRRGPAVAERQQSDRRQRS